MLNVKFEGVKELQEKLGKLARQIPFAVSQAMNKTVKAIQEAEKNEMKKVFDRPTPWVLNGVYIQPSTKKDLTAEIGLKDFGGGVPAVKILRPQIFGGDRNLKRFEKALQRVGVLPGGMKAVPGSGAQYDQFGNMSRGQIVKVLSYFRAFGEQGYSANIREKKKAKLKRGTKKQVGHEYFAIKRQRGKLPPGIYQKFHLGHGKAIKPILIFVSDTSYSPRFDFYGVGKKTIERELQKNFDEALSNAIKTAK